MIGKLTICYATTLAVAINGRAHSQKHLFAHSFFSNGGHGLRHSYAQERMAELKSLGLARAIALETVSQELGHFRAEITEVYLR